MIGELEIERSFQSGNQSKQTEMFCSIDRLMVIFKQHADDLRKESTEAEKDVMLDINQTAIQIGYLMGYYGHFDGTPQRYYEYGLPCISLFIEYGHELSALRADFFYRRWDHDVITARVVRPPKRIPHNRLGWPLPSA